MNLQDAEIIFGLIAKVNEIEQRLDDLENTKSKKAH